MNFSQGACVLAKSIIMKPNLIRHCIIWARIFSEAKVSIPRSKLQNCWCKSARLKANFRWLIVIVGSLLVLMLSYILLYHNSRKKKQHLETQIEAERQAHNMQQKALSGKLKKSNEALHDALQQLDSSSSYCVIQSEPKKDYNSFVEAPICRHILDTVQHNFKSKINFINYKEYALQREQLLALRVAADENMDGFTVRLRKHFHGLTDDDATYCCLYLLDISDSDIAALMQKAYSTVCERKRKIKRIVGGEDQLSYTLRNLP